MSIYRMFIFSGLMVILLGATAAAQKASLEIWRWASTAVFDPATLEELVVRFEAEYPQVDAKITEIPGDVDEYAEKLQLAVASGSPPDVAFLNRTQILPLAMAGALAPLDTWFAGDEGSRFVPWAWNSCRYKGRRYGIPFTTDVRGLWWNKRLFQEAGLPGDTGPSSLDELASYALEDHAVRTGDGQIDRLGFAPWMGNWNAVGWLWAFGGEIVDVAAMRPTIDTPENIAALEWIADWAQAYPPADIAEEISGGGGRSGFTSGMLAMYPHISGFDRLIDAESIGLELGAGPVPHAPAGKNGTWAGGPGLVVPHGSGQQELAAAFIAFMTTEESQSYYYESFGHLPTVVASIQEAMEDADANERSFLAQLPHAHARTPLWRKVQQATDLTGLINGEISPTEFAAAAQKRLEADFAEVFHE